MGRPALASVVPFHPKPKTRWSAVYRGDDLIRRCRAWCPCGWKGPFHPVQVDDDEVVEKAALWAAMQDGRHHWKRAMRGET